MKNKIFTSIIILTLVLTLVPTAAFADVSVAQKEFTSGNEICKEVKLRGDSNSQLSKADEAYILEHSSKEAIAEYHKMAIDEAADKVNKDTSLYLEGSGSLSKKYTLDCGGEVIVTLKDEEIPTLKDEIAQLFISDVYAGTTQPAERYISFGSTRKYVVNFEFAILGNFSVQERVTYKVSKNGLDMTKHEAEILDATLLMREGKATSTKEDGVARSEGTNIHALGTYTYYWEVNGLNTSKGMIKLKATVKILKIDTANKRIQVREYPTLVQGPIY